MDCYTGGTSDYRYCDAHNRLLDDCRKIFGADCPSCSEKDAEIKRLRAAIEWACGEKGRQYFINMPSGIDVSAWDYYRVFTDELRRRAKEG